MAIQVLNTDADLTGKTLISAENAYTITGLHTFSRNPGAPFAVSAGSAFVPNLGCDAAQIGGSGFVPTANLGSGSAAAGVYLQGNQTWSSLVLSAFNSFAAWQDFSGSSTVTGWSSFTTKNIFYTRIDTLVFVTFTLQGTSNSTSTSFTLPYTANGTNPQLNIPIMAEDNGTQVANAAMGQLAAGSATFNCFTNIGGGAWTGSGTKFVFGQFFYKV